FFSSGTRDLRTTGPWWGIAGLAFVASGITAAALSRLPPPWHRFRLLRWVVAAVIVLLIEDITHSAGGTEGEAAGMNVAVWWASQRRWRWPAPMPRCGVETTIEIVQSKIV